MDLEEIVQRLAQDVPNAIGAIVCDYEGETVTLALGRAPLPAEAEDHARSYIPRAMVPDVDLGEFLLKLAGAEPCALIRLFDKHSKSHGTGPLTSLDLRYRGVDMLVRRLPEDYYVLLVLLRPALAARARVRLEAASRALAALVG